MTQQEYLNMLAEYEQSPRLTDDEIKAKEAQISRQTGKPYRLKPTEYMCPAGGLERDPRDMPIERRMNLEELRKVKMAPVVVDPLDAQLADYEKIAREEELNKLSPSRKLAEMLKDDIAKRNAAREAEKAHQQHLLTVKSQLDQIAAAEALAKWDTDFDALDMEQFAACRRQFTTPGACQLAARDSFNDLFTLIEAKQIEKGKALDSQMAEILAEKRRVEETTKRYGLRADAATTADSDLSANLKQLPPALQERALKLLGESVAAWKAFKQLHADDAAEMSAAAADAFGKWEALSKAEADFTQSVAAQVAGGAS